MARTSLAFLALAAALAAAGAADAIYIATPLHATADPAETEVGSVVTITIGASDDASRDDWAGKPVEIAWGYAVPEGDEGDTTERSGVVTDALVLGERADGTFAWTVPAELDDQNVRITVRSGDDVLAFTDVAVGDAQPVAYTLASSGSPVQEGVEGGEDDGVVPADGATNDAPAAGALAALVAVGLLALARRR